MRLKRMLSIVVITAMALTLMGCYGNFKLTKKVYEWNGSLDDDVVITAVFWGLNIIPVYSACLFVDAVLLNTIEHWTGENPLAFENSFDTIKTIQTDEGLYTVTMGNYRIQIAELENQEVVYSQTFEYDINNQVWTFNDNGTENNIAFIEDDHVLLILPDGDTQIIPLEN